MLTIPSLIIISSCQLKICILTSQGLMNTTKCKLLIQQPNPLLFLFLQAFPLLVDGPSNCLIRSPLGIILKILDCWLVTIQLERRLGCYPYRCLLSEHQPDYSLSPAIHNPPPSPLESTYFSNLFTFHL